MSPVATLYGICKGLRATPHGLPCVSPLSRESICRFRQFSSGQMSPAFSPNHEVGNSILLSYEATYRSLALQPAGLLDSPSGPLLRNSASGLPLTPPSSYVGELPNSHGRTLTDESYVVHGIRSGLAILHSLLNFISFCCLHPPHRTAHCSIMNAPIFCNLLHPITMSEYTPYKMCYCKNPLLFLPRRG